MKCYSERKYRLKDEKWKGVKEERLWEYNKCKLLNQQVEMLVQPMEKL